MRWYRKYEQYGPQKYVEIELKKPISLVMDSERTRIPISKGLRAYLHGA